MEGQIFIEGEITPQTTLDVKDVLLRNQNAESFCIHISSPGGSVYDGYKIFHAIRNAATQNGKTKPVRAVIEGEAQSMATFIAMAADKGSIEIADPSRYMIHNPSMGVKGTSADFQQGASELAQIEDEMAATYAMRTGLSIDQCKEMMKNTTTMTAREAVTKGFADKLSSNLRAVALGNHMENEEVKTLGQKIDKLIETVTGKPKAVTGPPKQAAPPAPPKPAMVDAPLQDGTTLSIDAPNEDSLIGAPATINGAPAPDGDYPCQDGDIITVAGGIVTEVTTAMDALAKQNSELQAKLDALTPTVAKVEEQIKVIEEVKTTAKALKEELTTLKNKTVGNPDKPNEGLASRQPAGQGPSAMAAQETANFLGKEMPWLAQYNTKRGNSPVLGTQIETGPQAVSILETNFNYTYPGILTTDIYYKPTLDTPALSDMFTIDQGISFQKKYNLVTQLSNLLQPYGGCTRLFNNNRQLITNATVVTKEFQIAESWCKDDFTGQLTGVYNYLAQEWLKTGIASFDPTGTPIAQVIDKVLSDALRRDVFQRATMGAGNSSSSNYNQIDGLWDRLIDSSGASNYCVVKRGTAFGTGTLASGAALTALSEVFAAANPLLKQMIGKATFWVTGSVYDNYVQSLVGTGNVSANQFQNTIDGVNGSLSLTVGGGINYLGIPVKPVRFWDQSLQDPNNPLNGTTRHLILLTVKENHILGVENGGDLNKIEGWYERKDRKFYYESDMKFGYNYLHCDLQAIAY